jgi:hypothetical protein
MGTRILIGVLIALAIVIAVVALVRLDTTGKKGSGLGKEYLYEIDAKIDPNLILYEESAQPISTGFTDSYGIALDSQGSIYIAGDKAIRVFTGSGNLLDKIELTDVPRCLTVAGDGRIYVGMKNYVEVYNDDGKRLAT